jgi:hypothetical protein
MHTPPKTMLEAIRVLDHVIYERGTGNTMGDEIEVTTFLMGVAKYLRNISLG